MRAIVFALRGCPASWLGTYGNEWVATPYLDRVAAESIVFDQHYSDCPEPAAANRAWLADGKLFDELCAAGAHTVLVRANHPDTDLPDSHYAAWDEVGDARPQAEDASPLDHLIRSLPSVLDKLATVPRWLVWIEIDRLLPPWEVPQDVFEAYIADEDAEPLEDEEPIAPCVDPPVGPFDRSDLAAWDWLHGSFAAVVTALDAELGASSRNFAAAAWIKPLRGYSHPISATRWVNTARSACIAPGCTRNSCICRSSCDCPERRTPGTESRGSRNLLMWLS